MFAVERFRFKKGEVKKIASFCKSRGFKGEKLVTCIYSTIGDLRRGRSFEEIQKISKELQEMNDEDKNFPERFMQWLQRVRIKTG